MALKKAAMPSSLTTTWCYISLLLAVTVYLVLGASNTSCPTGFYFNNNTTKCECDEFLVDHNYIQCNLLEKRAYINNEVCLVSATNSNTYSVGLCPLTLGNWENITNRLYSELPSDPDMLNATMCGPYNREGYLCGKCIDGYGLPVYSHDLKCVNCSKFSRGVSIVMYIIIQFVLITLFFVCAVVFHLNITSGPLLGYFIFCQMYFVSDRGTQNIFDFISNHASEYIKVLFKISQTLSELWSLLFFKSLIPPFCISEKLSSVHIQLLTVVPAIYVVVLVITIWVLMDLHARNYKVIHFLCKPFRPFLKHLNIAIFGSNAIFNAFATFTFLSSTTLVMSVSTLTVYSILHIKSINHNVINITQVLYIDPSVVYYSHEHILYFMIAMVPCILLVFIPALLLCVYPTRIYRRLSQLISTRKQLAITAFAEALHNCFKDGLNGTRDYRALAGLIILNYPVAFLLSYITWKIVAPPTGLTRDCISGYTAFALSLVVSYVRPCKSTLANFSLSYHVFMFGVLLLGKKYWYYDISVKTEALELTFIIIPFLSHMFVFFWLVYIIIYRYVDINIFLSQINVCHRNTFLSVCRQCFCCRKRNGYQKLPDSASTGDT